MAPEKGKSGAQRKGRRGAQTAAAVAAPATSASRPAIAVIGAGRLGTALAVALAARGYAITVLVARRRHHAERAAALVAAATGGSGARPAALSMARLNFLPRADLLLITTPDDAVANAAARLASALTWPRSGRPAAALHASGALSSEALAALRAPGFDIGSMHPLVSVSDPVAGAERLRGAFYCLEGDRPAVQVGRRLVRDLGGYGFSINTRDKALYHLAAVMSSGHMVALFDMAAELLTRCGLSAARARRVLGPLVRSTFENLSKQAPARALTGTFARADVATVRRHLAALDPPHASDILPVYALLGRRSLQLAAENYPETAPAVTEIALALDAVLHDALIKTPAAVSDNQNCPR